MTVATPTASAPCVCHASSKTGRCSTNAQYQELHHVIPQAWQNWKLNAEKLFDARTLPICPTGHRGVHYWLVRLTKALPAKVLDDSAGDRVALNVAYNAVRAQAKKDGRIINKKEIDISLLALTRWLEKGYTLKELVSNQLWGEA